MSSTSRIVKYAIILRGFSYHVNHKGGVDWRLMMPNFENNVLQPLLNNESNVIIDLYLTTYESEKQQELIHHFLELENKFNKRVILRDALLLPTFGENFNQRDTALTALQIIQNPTTYFMIYMYRFDLFLRIPIIDLNIKQDHINIPWRELAHYWRAHRRICDLFFAFPGKYHLAMCNAINKHKDKTNLHKLYNILKDQDQIYIHFMTKDSEYYDSNTDRLQNPFFIILRASKCT